MDIVTLQPGTTLYDICKLVSKKRKAIVAKPCTEVRISNSYWDGGSRSDYFLVHIASKTATPIAGVAPVQFGGPKEDPVQKIEPGYAVVEAGTFCGKPSTPTVYLRPDSGIGYFVAV